MNTLFAGGIDLKPQTIRLAGAQDNGTQGFEFAGLGSTYEPTGGNGGFCFINLKKPNYQVTSYTHNQYLYCKTDDFPVFPNF